MFVYGGLAQLARALALQARGHRFESDILHHQKQKQVVFILKFFLNEEEFFGLIKNFMIILR